MQRNVVALVLVAGLTLLTAACGAAGKPQSASTTTTTTHAAASSTTTTTGGSSATSSSSPYLVAPGQVAFASPSGAISCEINYTSGGSTNAAFCETTSPPQSASLSTAGAVKVCGIGCEGNPAQNTPILAYGSSAGLGPFQCRSATSGVTCTASGKGFVISGAGIGPVGAPVVDLAPGSYSGKVGTVSPDGSHMTFTVSTTGCNGVPSPGTWSVDLTGATFVANATPATGQGQAVTLSASQWAQSVASQPTWTVVAVTGHPLEVTDGPTC